MKPLSIALLDIETLLNDFRDNTRKYLVVDSRPEQDYLNGHIPGAIRIAWEGWCERAPAEAAPILHEPGYWGTLADSDDQVFEQRLIEAGIRQHAPLLVYADSVRSKGREGRIAWMLLYLGASNVFILDQGWKEWVDSGGPVETGEPPAIPKGDFKISLDHKRRAKHHDVFENDELPLMIDTRTAAEFHGDCYDYQPFKGKLPNSILFPFADLFESDGTFVNRDRYFQIAPADIMSTQNRVSYCEVGVRAATFSLLHEIYTGEVIPVYDGSIIEWGWLREHPGPRVDT